MRIGLVGKPNVGKSTTFAALTESAVEIANYPFTTIDPNVGVTFLPAEAICPCKTLREKREADGRLEPTTSEDARAGSLCEPRTGTCIGHCRTVPITLVDVAGLVPGAHDGRVEGINSSTTLPNVMPSFRWWTHLGGQILKAIHWDLVLVIRWMNMHSLWMNWPCGYRAS